MTGSRWLLLPVSESLKSRIQLPTSGKEPCVKEARKLRTLMKFPCQHPLWNSEMMRHVCRCAVRAGHTSVSSHRWCASYSIYNTQFSAVPKSFRATKHLRKWLVVCGQIQIQSPPLFPSPPPAGGLVSHWPDAFWSHTNLLISQGLIL